MYLTRTPYNYISRKTSTNFRYLISNIKIILAELFSTKNHKEGMWREKRMFHLIFKRRIIHSLVCRERKGKLKIKAKS